MEEIICNSKQNKRKRIKSAFVLSQSIYCIFIVNIV